MFLVVAVLFSISCYLVYICRLWVKLNGASQSPHVIPQQESDIPAFIGVTESGSKRHDQEGTACIPDNLTSLLYEGRACGSVTHLSCISYLCQWSHLNKNNGFLC